jgi:hypothetical protein
MTSQLSSPQRIDRVAQKSASNGKGAKFANLLQVQAIGRTKPSRPENDLEASVFQSAVAKPPWNAGHVFWCAERVSAGVWNPTLHQVIAFWEN